MCQFSRLFVVPLDLLSLDGAGSTLGWDRESGNPGGQIFCVGLLLKLPEDALISWALEGRISKCEGQGREQMPVI